MSSLTFEAYGVPLSVTFTDEELRPVLSEILPPGAQPLEHPPSAPTFVLRRSGPDGYELALGEEPVALDATLAFALETLDQQIRLHIAANARDWIFVHAGVVAADAAAIVLPGPSFSGKTTLVRALLERGASYLSDEYAVLDPQGRVHPYPRRLSIRGESGDEPSERHARELGASAETGPQRVTLVAVLPYRPQARSSWEQISRARAAVALLANTVPAQARPQDSLRALASAVADATLIGGERGEAAAAAELLLEELATTRATAP